MELEELRQLIKHGETSFVQFKEMFSSSAKIADERIACANSRGGCILFGIKDKTGEITGITYEQVQEISREVGNIANDQVRPTIYITTEVVEIDGKMVLAVHVQEGKDKPYKNLAGNIWVKQGADKRRVTDNADLGSGIPRVLSEDSNVEFVDDKAGNQFKAIIKRPAVPSAQVAHEVAQEIRQVSDQVSDQVLTK